MLGDIHTTGGVEGSNLPVAAARPNSDSKGRGGPTPCPHHKVNEEARLTHSSNGHKYPHITHNSTTTHFHRYYDQCVSFISRHILGRNAIQSKSPDRQERFWLKCLKTKDNKSFVILATVLPDLIAFFSFYCSPCLLMFQRITLCVFAFNCQWKEIQFRNTSVSLFLLRSGTPKDRDKAVNPSRVAGFMPGHAEGGAYSLALEERVSPTFMSLESRQFRPGRNAFWEKPGSAAKP